MLPLVDSHEMPELFEVLGTATSQLVEEIKSQRTLIDAESGDLTVEQLVIDADSLVDDVVGFYRSHDVAREKHIVIESDAQGLETEFTSDPTLVRRVLGNLVKNALEATEPGMTVTVRVIKRDDTVEFWVHNDEVIPEGMQFQIFQRSFSTKGKGRGTGTYSVRLFTERYLGGRASFTSSRDDGTRFSVMFPRTAESPLTESGATPRT